jgi:hypothetical protein
VHLWYSMSQNRDMGHPTPGKNRRRARGFYETAGGVKVFVFAFVFSLLALLFLLLPLFVLVFCIHLGLLSALWVNPLLGSVPVGVRFMGIQRCEGSSSEAGCVEKRRVSAASRRGELASWRENRVLTQTLKAPAPSVWKGSQWR